MREAIVADHLHPRRVVRARPRRCAEPEDGQRCRQRARRQLRGIEADHDREIRARHDGIGRRWSGPERARSNAEWASSRDGAGADPASAPLPCIVTSDGCGQRFGQRAQPRRHLQGAALPPGDENRPLRPRQEIRGAVEYRAGRARRAAPGERPWRAGTAGVVGDPGATSKMHRAPRIGEGELARVSAPVRRRVRGRDETRLDGALDGDREFPIGHDDEWRAIAPGLRERIRRPRPAPSSAASTATPGASLKRPGDGRHHAGRRPAPPPRREVRSVPRAAATPLSTRPARIDRLRRRARRAPRAEANAVRAPALARVRRSDRPPWASGQPRASGVACSTTPRRCSRRPLAAARRARLGSGRPVFAAHGPPIHDGPRATPATRRRRRRQRASDVEHGRMRSSAWRRLASELA